VSSEKEHGIYRKAVVDSLPKIGLLVFDGVLTTEVTAAMDVFAKMSEGGTRLFNVFTIAESKESFRSEEGLVMIPDFTYEDTPELDVLFVPSGYDMHAQVNNAKTLDFIRTQNANTKYTVSNCAGAQLIGASGIAAGKKIVTYIGGGKELQEAHPDLKVQNDSLVTFVEDGKFLSSNGNLASYISALQLLEKLAGAEHRKYVEGYLYMERLKNWGE
jgi:transcriptional regulator GlxA family with amidase domain